MWWGTTAVVAVTWLFRLTHAMLEMSMAPEDLNVYYAEEGRPKSIECIVIVDVGVKVNLTWSSSSIDTSKPQRVSNIPQGKYDRVGNWLNITNFSNATAGEYKCRAITSAPNDLNRIIKLVKSCDIGKYNPPSCKESCTSFCNPVPGGAKGRNCDHITGKCLYGCQDGHAGSKCTECDVKRFNPPSCNMWCSLYCKPGPYGVRGRNCDQINSTCLFGCQEGYKMPNCTEKIDEPGEEDVGAFIGGAVLGGIIGGVLLVLVLTIIIIVVVVVRHVKKRRTERGDAGAVPEAIPLQGAYTENLESAMTRIQEMEEALLSLNNKVDKQQVDFDTLNNQVDGEMTKTHENEGEKMAKQEKTAKKINRIEQILAGLEEREAQNAEKLKAVEKKVSQEKIKQENFEAVERQREKKLENVEKKLDQLETSNTSLSNKVGEQEYDIQVLTSTVKTHTETLENQTSPIQELTETLGIHSTSLENQTSSIQELTTTVEKHSTTLGDVTSDREKEATELRVVQNKVRRLEREKNKALKNVGKQLEDVSFKYQMVCKIVADRLVPLERLREILNDKAKNSDDNVQKATKPTHQRCYAKSETYIYYWTLDMNNGPDLLETPPTLEATVLQALYAVIQDVKNLEPRVSHLEQQPILAVRVDAHGVTPVQEKNIDKWECKEGSTGGHFDFYTGIFTAPVAGDYAVGLCMWQEKEGKIVLCIKKIRSGSHQSVSSGVNVAGAATDRSGSTNCGFSVVDLSVGDKLYVNVLRVDKGGDKGCPILKSCKFSIFLIK